MALITPKNLGANELNLADNYAFTGTVTGAGVSGKVLQTVLHYDSTTANLSLIHI